MCLPPSPGVTGVMNKLVLFVFVSFMLYGSCYAYDLHVDSGANPNGADGTSQHPYLRIQDAIDHSFNDNLNQNQGNPSVQIFVKPNESGYLEGLELNYRINSEQSHNVQNICIRSETGYNTQCHIIAPEGVNMAVKVFGSDTGVLSLNDVKISRESAMDGSYGVGFDHNSGTNNYASLQKLEITNCFFDNHLYSIGYATAIDTLIVTLSTVHSTYDDTHPTGPTGIGIHGSDSPHSQAVISNNQVSFTIAPGYTAIGAALLITSFTNVDIYSNTFTNGHVDYVSLRGSQNVPNILIDSNKFIDSSVHLYGIVNSVISNNTFYCPSELLEGDSVIVLLNTEDSADATHLIQKNTFWDIPTPILLDISTSWPFLRVSASLSNNSFFNCDRIAKINRHSNQQIPTNRISLYQNNLFVGQSDSLFVIVNTNDQPITLNENDRIPVSYSHFFPEIDTSSPLLESLDVNTASLTHGDPLITIDSENHSYTLNWNENERSPLILKGYIGGMSSNQYDGRPDIGAVQYDEYPHENRSYTFPAGNDRNGIKWMSFPSLDRIYGDEDMAHTFFDPLCSPSIIEQITWKELNYEPQSLQLDVNFNWLGDNHAIQPQIGYKVQMYTGLQNSISISTPGLKPDPNLPITLKAWTNQRAPIPNNENWLGYLGVRIVSPFEAFASVLDNLWYIQSQDWTLSRMQVAPGSPWVQIYYPGSKRPTLRHGDMVIVKCFEDADFTWNAEAPEREPFTKEEATHFTFAEKLDYVPVYVEFTGTDLPQEAAVFLEGLCKGAAVVGGSSVEIPAYILDDIGSGAELELRVFYDRKASYNAIPSYQSWNMETEQYEDNALSLSEYKHYYMMKMDAGSLNDSPIPKLYMENHPNPFNPDTTLRFSLPEAADIDLGIYNLKGQKVRNLLNDTKTAGMHSCLWDAQDNNGNKVASGIYFAVLSYQGNQLSRKLLLMK